MVESPRKPASMSKAALAARHGVLIGTLLEARKKEGLTQGALAERLGVPQSYVSKYERGHRRLDVIEFLVVTQSLGLDAAGLLAMLGTV